MYKIFLERRTDTDKPPVMISYCYYEWLTLFNKSEIKIIFRMQL
jgi:hypothetical protein